MFTHPICHYDGGPDKWFRISDGKADVTEIFGAAPEEIYRTGEPSSGNVVGAVAGNVLSPVTSPLYKQVLTGLADDPLGVGFDSGTTDSFDAANSSVHDYDNVTAFAILFPIKITTVGSSHLGKRTTGTNGWYVSSSAIRIYFSLLGTAGASNPPLVWVADSNLHWVFVYQTVTGGTLGILGDMDMTDGTIPIATIGDMSNAALFALGSSRLAAAGCVLGPTVFWSGANAETVIANRATTIPLWWAM